MGTRERERATERVGRRNVYTGLVGQSFLLRRSFAEAQAAFNQIILHEKEKNLFASGPTAAVAVGDGLLAVSTRCGPGELPRVHIVRCR